MLRAGPPSSPCCSPSGWIARSASRRRAGIRWSGWASTWAGSAGASPRAKCAAGADWRALLRRARWPGAAARCWPALAALLLQSSLLRLGELLAALLLGVRSSRCSPGACCARGAGGRARAGARSTPAARSWAAWSAAMSCASSDSEVRESAIESLAENLNDSVVAPVFWFVVAGLPGAALYRFANTADAMWGYRGVRAGVLGMGRQVGRARRRCAVVAAGAHHRVAAGRWRRGGLAAAALRREAGRTPSPNSGWPMAAMALLLDVRLRKPGVYVAARGRRTGRRPSDTPARRATGARAASPCCWCVGRGGRASLIAQEWPW